MGLFYKYVAQSMGRLDAQGGALVLEAGKLSPYTAVVVFSTGLVASNFVWNTAIMIRPFTGTRVPFKDYFTKGTVRLHAVGILGGMIWGTGMAMSIIASTRAGAALSYGLGQGATLVGALWGVFVWKEFKGAPAGTPRMLAAMFAFYVAGLNPPGALEVLTSGSPSSHGVRTEKLGCRGGQLQHGHDPQGRPGPDARGNAARRRIFHRRGRQGRQPGRRLREGGSPHRAGRKPGKRFPRRRGLGQLQEGGPGRITRAPRQGETLRRRAHLRRRGRREQHRGRGRREPEPVAFPCRRC